MSAAISQAKKLASTETTIVGTLPDVFAEIERMFRDYHPYGYGTSVKMIRHAGADQYEARVERANSCD